MATLSMVGLDKRNDSILWIVLILSSGTNKPMDTINAKTHHDFVNPIYPASTKVDMMLFLHTLCLFCSI